MFSILSPRIGFIGTGNMGAALATTALKTLASKDVLLSDQESSKAQNIAASLGCTAAGSEVIARECDFIFLGVKPNVLPELLHILLPILNTRKSKPALISMAAGVTIAQIEEMTDHSYPILRIMPNTPVSLGAGVILYAGNKLLTQAQLDSFKHCMGKAGSLCPLDESLIDAGSAVSGCGPAFVYLFIDALADGGVAAGLSRKDAQLFAAQTVAGAAQMVMQSGVHPEQLKNEVCSPGGSTIQGVRALEQHAFRSACMEAVLAAFVKTQELGEVQK